MSASAAGLRFSSTLQSLVTPASLEQRSPASQFLSAVVVTAALQSLITPAHRPATPTSQPLYYRPTALDSCIINLSQLDPFLVSSIVEVLIAPAPPTQRSPTSYTLTQPTLSGNYIPSI